MLYKRFISSAKRLVPLGQLVRKMSSKYQVFITRADMPDCGLDLLKKECDITCWSKSTPITSEDLKENVAGKHAIFCSLNEKIDKAVIEAAGSNLKVISTISVGLDHIDVAECKSRGIKIGYTPNVLTDATAELTMALLLATSRRIPEAIHEAKTGGWVSWAPMWMTGPGLADATVGIVGMGRIGQAVAKRVHAFNPAKILYFNRSERAEAKEFGGIKVSFDELLAQSDFVIVCCALVPETKLLFNKTAFEKMKPTSIFVNTSRGAVVDQDALIEALQNKKIRAAGLDVTTPEPLPLDNSLFQLSNCVVLPHIGSASIETRNTMSVLTAQNILSALKGEEMPAEYKL